MRQAASAQPCVGKVAPRRGPSKRGAAAKQAADTAGSILSTLKDAKESFKVYKSCRVVSERGGRKITSFDELLNYYQASRHDSLMSSFEIEFDHYSG